MTGAYFAQLETQYRDAGVVVPLYDISLPTCSICYADVVMCRTYNEPGEGRNFVNGTGAVDIYGLVRPVACFSPNLGLIGCRIPTLKVSIVRTRQTGTASRQTTINITRK